MRYDPEFLARAYDYLDRLEASRLTVFERNAAGYLECEFRLTPSMADEIVRMWAEREREDDAA